jgi:hypothetical protein
MFRKLISASVMMALSFSSAEAAMLTNIQGAVSVDQGNGFKPVNAATELAAGTRIRAGGGSADLVYGNGCSVRVASGEVVAVQYTPPTCYTGGGLKDGGPVAVEPGPDYYALGGVAIAGAAIIAIAASQTSSASP